jgi:hypothetical protein
MNGINHCIPRQSQWTSYVALPAARSISTFFFAEQLPALEIVCKSWRSVFGNEVIWKLKCRDEGVEWQPIEQLLLQQWRPLVSKVGVLALPLIIMADYVGYDSQQTQGRLNIYKQQFAHPKPVVAFGPNKWKLHFGYDFIGAEPRLPPSIHRDVAFGKMRNCILTLVNCGYSLSRIVEEAQRPVEGPPITVDIEENIKEGYGRSAVSRMRWVVMPKVIAENSRVTTWQSARLIADSSLNYRMGNVVEIVMSVVAHYMRSGECLFAKNTYTWTLSASRTWAACVGNGTPASLISAAKFTVLTINLEDALPWLGVAPVTLATL